MVLTPAVWKRRRKRGKVKVEESKREIRTEREREKNETPQHQKRNQRSWIVSIVAVPSRGKDVGNTRGWRGHRWNPICHQIHEENRTSAPETNTQKVPITHRTC